MQNRIKLNSDKCKELRISFVKDEPQFAPIVVDGNELKKVTSAKLLGLTISSKHTWNIINKASRRPYFFGAAKEIESSLAGYVHFLLCLYTALFLTYATPAFFMPCQST